MNNSQPASETIEQHLINHLINSFLEESLAVSIVDQLKQHTKNNKIDIKYNDLTTDYPHNLIRSLESMCDEHALKYLKEHRPKHFAIGIFSF